MSDASIPRAVLDSILGEPIGDPVGSVAPDPVNLAMIRHWAAAFDDHNPVYLDEKAAVASRHGGLVAPPAMLQTWIMATPMLEGIGERGGAPRPAAASPLKVFDDAGYRGSLAVNSEFEFERYLRLGETVTSTSEVEGISDEKNTRLGPGHFITWLTTFRVGDEVVGRQRFRMLKFRPEAAA